MPKSLLFFSETALLIPYPHFSSSWSSKALIHTKKMAHFSLLSPVFFPVYCPYTLKWCFLIKNFIYVNGYFFLKFLYHVIVRKDFLTQKFILNSPTVSFPPWPSHPCFCLQLPWSRLDWGRTTRGPRSPGQGPPAPGASSQKARDADGKQRNGNEMQSCGL